MNELINFLKNNSHILIVGLFIGIIVLILLIVVIIFNNRDRSEYQRILDNITNPRIYILDYGRSEASYFNRGNYSNIQKGDLSEFYKHFAVNDQEILEKWVNDLFNKTPNTPNFSTIDVFVASLGRTYLSMIEVTKIDYNKKIIHMESYLFLNLNPKHQVNFKVRKTEKIRYPNPKKLIKIFKNCQTRKEGYYGAISVIPTQKNKDSFAYAHVYYQLKDYAAFYRNKSIILQFNEEKHTVGIFFPKANNLNKIRPIVDAIIFQMNAYLEVNDFENFTLAAGIAFAPQFNESKTLFNTAEELSVFAQKEKNKLLIHNPNEEVKDLDLTVYRNELMNIVSSKKVEILFQPLVSSHNVEIIGHIASFTLDSQTFTSYAELANFAKENGKSELLTKMVLRLTTSRYYNSRRNAKDLLFVPLYLDEVAYLSEIFVAQAFIKSIPLVFLIEENDLSNNYETVEEMSAAIKAVKNEGYQIALVLSDSELVLPTQILSEADFFIVNEKTLTHVTGIERERLYLLTSLGKLLRYKKPIMMSGLKTWADIEYYIKAGIDAVASDEISKKAPSIVSVDKKRAMKILNFNKTKRR